MGVAQISHSGQMDQLLEEAGISASAIVSEVRALIPARIAD